MNKMFAALAITAAGFATSATADALSDAVARNACNDFKVLGAEYLATGQLKVLCPRGAVPGATPVASSALEGTGLAGGGTVGAVVGVVVLAALVGDSDNSTTTTTTTSP